MHHASTLKELVEIAKDGQGFYEEAATKVDDQNLKSIFTQMAGHKRDIIASLSAKLVAANEDVPDHGTMAGKFRQSYTDLRAAMSKDDAKIYVSQLEETEDRLLHHFKDAAEKIDDAEVQAVVRANLPQVQSCHDQMRTLKHSYQS